MPSHSSNCCKLEWRYNVVSLSNSLHHQWLHCVFLPPPLSWLSPTHLPVLLICCPPPHYPCTLILPSSLSPPLLPISLAPSFSPHLSPSSSPFTLHPHSCPSPSPSPFPTEATIETGGTTRRRRCGSREPRGSSPASRPPTTRKAPTTSLTWCRGGRHSRNCLLSTTAWRRSLNSLPPWECTTLPLWACPQQQLCRRVQCHTHIIHCIILWTVEVWLCCNALCSGGPCGFAWIAK